MLLSRIPDPRQRKWHTSRVETLPERVGGATLSGGINRRPGPSRARAHGPSWALDCLRPFAWSGALTVCGLEPEQAEWSADCEEFHADDTRPEELGREVLGEPG